MTEKQDTATATTIPIIELFISVQGEGLHVGLPTIFIRTGGCDYKCSWCDSNHASRSEFKDSWVNMTTEEIITSIEKITSGNPCLITFTGGNPALRNFGPLIEWGEELGYTFDMETQGTVCADWFPKMGSITFSPKPPSSGMVTDVDKLANCIESIGADNASLKIVVGDDADYKYAMRIFELFPEVKRKYISALNVSPGAPSTQGIIDSTKVTIQRVLDDKAYDVKVLPQVHVLLWGNELLR